MGRWETFWTGKDGRPNAEIETYADFFAAGSYILANPVLSDLVASSSDWTGFTSINAPFGTTLECPRPDKFFSNNMPDTVDLHFSRPVFAEGFDADYYANTTDGEIWSELLDVVSVREKQAWEEREAKNKSVMGIQAIIAQSRLDSPLSRAPRRQPHPWFVSKYPKVAKAQQRRHAIFIANYERSMQELTAKSDKTVFPAGTWDLAARGIVATDSV